LNQLETGGPGPPAARARASQLELEARPPASMPERPGTLMPRPARSGQDSVTASGRQLASW
jgi:hypothetical protein